MSSPANRTAWREEENRPAPASQQVIASAVTGPAPLQPGGQRLGAGQVPGRAGQLVPDHVQPGLQRIDHLQGGGDLQLPGRGQVGGCRGPQPGHALPGAQRALPAAGRPGGTAPRGSAATRRCARGAGRWTARAAPGTPGCGRAGSSTPAAGPRPAAAAGAGRRSCRSWRAACGRARRRYRPARPDAPRSRPPPVSSQTYRQPAHPSTANATSSWPANRASQARRCARPAGAIWPRRTCPVTVPRQSKVICQRWISSPPTMSIGTSSSSGERTPSHANCLRSQS